MSLPTGFFHTKTYKNVAFEVSTRFDATHALHCHRIIVRGLKFSASRETVLPITL